MKIKIGNVSRVLSLIYEGILRYHCLRHQELTVL